MTSTKFRVESGMQMIARLTKKPDMENFYPNLFKNSLKQGHVIEIYSDDDTSCLLNDIICESLIPLRLGGKESGVIVFNTDGKFNLDKTINVFKKKVVDRLSDSALLENLIENALHNLFIFDIYNATQLHSTIQSMDSILLNHSNVSLIVFDTLTAFYWSEQSFKLTKQDIYLKCLLKLIQQVVKDYKVVILYSRPGYFSSSKENIENLEPCCEHPLLNHLNFRIQVVFTEDGTHIVTVQTYNENYKCFFNILDNNIVWCQVHNV